MKPILHKHDWLLYIHKLFRERTIFEILQYHFIWDTLHQWSDDWPTDLYTLRSVCRDQWPSRLNYRMASQMTKRLKSPSFFYQSIWFIGDIPSLSTEKNVNVNEKPGFQRKHCSSVKKPWFINKKVCLVFTYKFKQQKCSSREKKTLRLIEKPQ